MAHKKRNGDTVIIPSCFLRQYIFEIENFIEERTPNDAYDKICRLLEKQSYFSSPYCHKLLKNAEWNLLCLYSDQLAGGDQVLIDRFVRYQKRTFYSEKITNGDYRSALSFIYNNTSYKVKHHCYDWNSINLYDECLIDVLSSLKQYFLLHKFDVFKAWVGKKRINKS